MQQTETVPVLERVRRPGTRSAPHPHLQPLLTRDYASFTDATTPDGGFVLPARASILIVLTLQGPPWSPAALAGGHDAFWSVGREGACPPAYMEIWLAPLGAYQLLGMPMDMLSGRQLDLTDVLGSDARRIIDQVREAPSWRQRCDLLDEFLMCGARNGPDPAPEVAWAWRRLNATGGMLPISQLAREVGWSHKHLITRFKQQVGLPPKTAARLARLDAVWRRLANCQPARWDAIAADSGYADQAHLIRDFHTFVGGSPTAFFARPEVPIASEPPPRASSSPSST